jgi:hypothetical protein
LPGVAAAFALPGSRRRRRVQVWREVTDTDIAQAQVARSDAAESPRGTPAAIEGEHATTALTTRKASLLMRTSFLASALLASLTASSLVACGGSDDGPRTFADADEDTRTAAVAAATGDLSILAGDLAKTIAVVAHAANAPCPKATLSGTDLTVTGGCTINGATLSGSFVLHGFSEDIEETMTGVDFADFGFVEDGDEVVFDGRVAAEPGGNGVGQVLISDLTMTVEAEGETHAVSVVGRMSCNDDLMCSPQGALNVEVDSLALAAVAGTWRPAPARAGAISLVGDDSYSVDFEAGNAAGCYATQLDGAASEPLCLDGDDDEDGEDESALRAIAARVGR